MQRVFICEERYIKRKSFGKENSDCLCNAAG
jgi:hypothetical protein